MVISERTLKWVMRFYPPLFFQRIWVKRIEKGFRRVDVCIAKSIFNINYNKSIFGGTIFSATDPFYAVCLYQILIRRGYKIKLWVKSAEINYLNPAFNSLHFSVCLKDEEIEDICRELDVCEKTTKVFQLEVTNKQGKLCVTVKNEVYIRKL